MYQVYVSISAVGFVLLYWAVPETKGIPLEEIAALFGDKEDIMVYQAQIHVDHTTHKLVIEDRGSEIETAQRQTEQKERPVQRDVIHREDV
jgi:hypothetical protein